MIVITDQQLTEMEKAHDASFPRRFHQWWQQHVAPEATTHATERLVFAHRDEFQIAGVREEEDKFLFLYARALMPDMGDTEYLESMDAIMTRAPLRARMRRLQAIAEEFGHRG